MSEISEVLSGIEGLAPEAIAAIEGYVKNKEAQLTENLETKYGVKPAVISDVEAVAQDVAPAAVKAVESVGGEDLKALIARLTSLEQQNSQLQAKIANPEQVVASGGGDPVPHNLFLADGSVVKNHGGVATEYSTTNADGTENVQKVVAAYPS
jgi:hypothetical protein